MIYKENTIIYNEFKDKSSNLHSPLISIKEDLYLFHPSHIFRCKKKICFVTDCIINRKVFNFIPSSNI
jgi:hypothetical protein